MRTQTHQRWISTLATVAVLGGGMLLSSTALAYTYTACFDMEVQNIDSNVTPTGGTMEDYYLTQNPTMVDARGFYIYVYNASDPHEPGNHIHAGYSDSTTGCFSFDDGGGNLVVDFVAISKARHGTTYVRAHDGGSSGGSAYPGEVYSLAVTNKIMAPGVTYNFVLPGGETWNAFTTASHALARVTTGLASKTINIGFDGEGSSASFSGAADWVEDDSYLIRINNGSDPNEGGDSRRKKFEVVHEMGHAAARLNYGQDGLEDPINTGFYYDAIEFFGCETSSSYSQRSVEHDSIGFKEGFANIYTARVFNDRANDGAIRLTGTTYSLEQFQDPSLGNPMGGHVRNHCYPFDTPPHGVSTTEDWTRFLWDIYTIPTATCGSPQLGLDEVYDLYIATRNGNPANSYSWHGEMIDAIEGSGTLSNCERDEALAYVDWNAIGGLYHGF